MYSLGLVETEGEISPALQWHPQFPMLWVPGPPQKLSQSFRRIKSCQQPTVRQVGPPCHISITSSMNTPLPCHSLRRWGAFLCSFGGAVVSALAGFSLLAGLTIITSQFYTSLSITGQCRSSTGVTIRKNFLCDGFDDDTSSNYSGDTSTFRAFAGHSCLGATCSAWGDPQVRSLLWIRSSL